MDTLIGRISSAIKEIEVSMAFDWRFSYVHVTSSESGECIIELSSGDLFEALPGRLAGIDVVPGPEGEFRAGPDGRRVTIRLLRPPEGRCLWVSSSIADIRREPSHAAELVTQSIMGEEAAALKLDGDWYLVMLPDGYHGWVRTWYVRETRSGAVASYRERANALVGANITYIRESADPDSLPVTDLVAGTAVLADKAEEGFRKVLLPGGREGFSPERDLEDITEPVEPLRDRIISRAMRFIGIPYLWGGTSTKGFDCSGLVKRVYLMEGIELPRDSDRQALVGEVVLLEESEPGELLFFGEGEAITHVAIYLGAKRFIHAYGEVRINSLDAEDPLFEPKLSGNLRVIRRVII
jgi:cell wall-associated NlpC family hydrolase